MFDFGPSLLANALAGVAAGDHRTVRADEKVVEDMTGFRIRSQNQKAEPRRGSKPWTPGGQPTIAARVQDRSCGDPNCRRCRRNKWVRRLTGGLAGYGG